ncbi:MAG: hypothetical protein EON89_13850 [Brevundimonas sp.]|nr:MAG: hypothetical protein EON89_13850 [Brevundimonas sp.]
MMFRFFVVALAGLLMAFQAAPSPRPQLTPALSALVEDAAAARTFDYLALKAEGVNLRTLADAVYMRTRTEGGPASGRCLTEAEAEIQSSLMAALAVDGPEAFERDRAAADEALGKWRAFSRSMAEGRVVTEEPFSWVSERYTAAAAETNPRVRELLTRAAGDQLIRRAFEGAEQIWGPLSPGAKARTDTALNTMMCETDGANTAWLKADIAANGWFLISTSGETASTTAWLMAQHADRDPAFQKAVLAMLEPLVARGETSAANYAYLWDRVAVGEHRPQRYGTQGRCAAKDVWAPQELEDPDRVDALRAEADIGTLAEYASHMNKYCADVAG